MSKNEEIFRFVVANQALEGMVMTDDEKKSYETVLKENDRLRMLSKTLFRLMQL